MRQYQGCAPKKLKGGQCSELVKSRAAYDCYAKTKIFLSHMSNNY